MSGLLERKISKSKESLLRSCVQILSVKLWDDISINDIEKYINKTRGSIFHHYKTKDELFTDAIIYFITKSNLRHLGKEETISQSFIRTLKDEFGVHNPENAFINLLVQCLYKRIDFITNPFLEIPLDSVNCEEQALGEILFNVLTK